MTLAMPLPPEALAAQQRRFRVECALAEYRDRTGEALREVAGLLYDHLPGTGCHVRWDESEREFVVTASGGEVLGRFAFILSTTPGDYEAQVRRWVETRFGRPESE